jgi:hypothetical protein
MWEPRRLTILWASTACYRDSFTFTLFRTEVTGSWASCHACSMERVFTLVLLRTRGAGCFERKHNNEFYTQKVITDGRLTLINERDPQQFFFLNHCIRAEFKLPSKRTPYDRAGWHSGSTPRLVFGKCLVRIPAGTPAVDTDRGFLGIRALPPPSSSL